MQSSENSVLDQLLSKLGLQKEEKLKEKTTELLRLLDIKSARAGSTINEYAKTIICIELASTPLGITFDTETGVKLSGLRKTAFQNYRRTFEKILELNKPVGVDEICVQLGLHEHQKKATQFLELYKKHVNENASDEVDIAHPQYSAMAVFQACKTGKCTKSMKRKLITYSHLKPAQWSKLELQWDKLLKEHQHDSVKSRKKNETADQDTNKENKPSVVASKRTKATIEAEDYETWKKRMLDYAYGKLREMKKGDPVS